MSKSLLRISGRRSSSKGRAGGFSLAPRGRRCRSHAALAAAGRCPETAEQNRVRNKLKRLIAKRPPLQTLQERGLLRGEGAGPPGTLVLRSCPL